LDENNDEHMRNGAMKKKDKHHMKKRKNTEHGSIPCKKISWQETPNSVGEWEDDEV